MRLIAPRLELSPNRLVPTDQVWIYFNNFLLAAFCMKVLLHAYVAFLSENVMLNASILNSFSYEIVQGRPQTCFQGKAFSYESVQGRPHTCFQGKAKFPGGRGGKSYYLP